MKSFQEYSKQNQGKASAQDSQTASTAADLTKKIAAAYNGKSNAAMLQNILREAERGKRDGTLSNEEIEQFRQEKGYTFYMGKCDSRWSKVLNIQSYPLTVVIDRFGNITMTHSGAVDSAQMFLDIFGYFTAEDYLQSFIRSHSQVPTYESK